MHIPVFYNLIKEYIKKLQINSVIDCTFGFGGHTRMFLENSLKVIAFDRDLTVKPYAEAIENNNFKFISDTFSNINKYSLDKVDLLIADLGLSSMQLDSNRGFSFMTDSNLDMGMGYNKLCLKDILKFMPAIKLYEIISTYGEEPQARKIASNIDKYRCKKNINTTFELREAIGIDKFPTLARVFQAFRIYINEELFQLNSLLDSAFDLVNKCIFIITFHSLESRIVKESFLKHKHLGYSKFHLPTEQDILENNKCRSAVLRIFFKKNFFLENIL